MSTNVTKKTASLPELVIRPEFEVSDLEQAQTGEVAITLSWFERIWNIDAVRKAVILLALVSVWQAYTVGFDVEPLFHGNLIHNIWFSIKVLIIGYGAGLFLAAILILWATAFRFGSDFIAMATAMFNPLPAIALLPPGVAPGGRS